MEKGKKNKSNLFQILAKGDAKVFKFATNLKEIVGCIRRGPSN